MPYAEVYMSTMPPVYKRVCKRLAMPLMISLKDSYEIKDQAQKFGSNKKHLVCNPGKSRLKVTTNVGQRVVRLSAFMRPQTVVLKRCLTVYCE